MTDSSTPCCKKTPRRLSDDGLRRRAVALALLGAVGALSSPRCLAETDVIVGSSEPRMHLARDGEELLLTADVQWRLPEIVSEALMQGIPVHFVADMEIRRERWYWSDQILLRAQRFLRLSYQPLTRRWRLYMGSQPFEGKGLSLALASTYENLQDALNAMQRLVRWRVGQISELPEQGPAVLLLRFRIDPSQFPRPLQIGALGRPDWNLLRVQQEQILLESLR